MKSVAEQNDRFRKAVFFSKQPNGKMVLTQGVVSLPKAQLTAIFKAIATYTFTEKDADNNPYGENDFGAVDVPAVPKCFWKLDYYDSPACEYGAEDAASPTTYRLMTIMLAEEY